MKRFAAATLALVLAAPALAQEKPDSVALTVYSTAQPGAVPADLYRPVPGGGYGGGRMQVPGYAVVKQERQISLNKARSTVRFSDVAALIDPTTVVFESLSDPAGTSVVEQNYQFDLVSPAKLMERYVDREVAVERNVGDKIETVAGTLLSSDGGLILQSKDGGVQVVNQYAAVRFPDLPGGLITKPTLVWDVATDKPGPQRARVTYQTGGLTWWADYNLTFAEGKNANSGVLDVNAWVSLLNQSGATYPEAGLKLIAGDVQRAQPAPQDVMGKRRLAMAAEAAPAGFEEKSFFEYHLYTLGRKTTLPDNSTKQIELFPPVSKVPAEKVLVYYGLSQGFRGFFADPIVDRNLGVESNKKVDVYLRFRNAKENGLGIPLPAGRIRVNKLDPADQSLEFIGEDTIDHTPKDEEVLIKLGNAFDVVGERKQVDFKVDLAKKTLEESIEVVLRNHKQEPVKVLVKENLYRWLNWQITQTTAKYDKLDARTVEFPVEVAKDGEATVRYTVRYGW
jgi:hypothetical protein